MPPAPRVPGRPRSQRATRAILGAAGELLDRYGFAGLTVDAIAKQAGVSKSTIYRWWPNKAAVAIDAFLASVTPQVAWPDSGSIREDTRWQMMAVADLLSSATGRRIAALVGEAQDDPGLAAALRDRFIRPRRRENRLAFERAIERGQLRPDLDVELAIDALYGPLYYRLLLGHHPVGRAFAERLFDAVFPSFEAPEEDRSTPAAGA